MRSAPLPHRPEHAHTEPGPARPVLPVLVALLACLCAVLAISWEVARAQGNAPGHQKPQRGGESQAAKDARRAATGNLVGHGGPVKAVSVWAFESQAGGAPVMTAAATGGFDYALMLWRLDGEIAVPTLRADAHDGAVNAVELVAPSGQRMAGQKTAAWHAGTVLTGGDDGIVRRWQLARGSDRPADTVGSRPQPIAQLAGHSAKIVAIAVSPDAGWAASASWDRTARLWDLARNAPGPVLVDHGGPVTAVAFSGDSTMLYTASQDGHVRQFEVATGALKHALYKHGWGINVLQRVPGPGPERLLLGALDGTAAILDAASGAVVHELASHAGPVLALAALDRPGLMATAGGDGRIRVYRLGDWQPIEEHHNPYGPVWALAFAPDGTSLYYAGLDDFVTRWQIAPRAAFEPVASDFPRRFQLKGDMSAGEQEFARKCSVCHTLEPDGRNRAGPTLHKVFGRKAGSLAGYPYSDGLRASGIVWSEETVGKLFELGPDEFTPGSKMPLQKITSPERRAALIDYLKQATQGP